MTDKAVISSYTYRSEESQRADHEGMPIFVLPQDLPQLFRKTTRKGTDTIYCSSLACLADTEKSFREFLCNAKERKADIFSKEDNKQFRVNDRTIEYLVRWWRDARRKGVNQIGAMRSGEKRRKDADRRASGMTKEEWYNLSYTNAQLEEKHGCRIGTLRRIAGDKGWCRNRVRGSILMESAQKRKERRNAKAN